MKNVRSVKRQHIRVYSVASLATLFAVTFIPSTAFAQSVDDCMSAGTASALTICRSILDSGSRNVDVYWKLSSAQFQDDQQALANKTLDTALRLHPGNAKLVALREIINSAATEQELIERSARLNQNSLDKGAMKISCLTKSGKDAIAACRRRLDLTDVDGDRIRARLAILESQQATSPNLSLDTDDSVVVATAPAIAPSEPPTNSPVDNNTSTKQNSDRLAADARKQVYKMLVTDVQSQLNYLGFNAGFPDGIPGAKTRDALAEFYSAIGAPVNTSINDVTLQDLNLEKRKLNVAKQLLTQSDQAIQQGNTSMARQRLSDAISASVLLNVPLQLEQQVRNNSITTVAVESPAPVRTATSQSQSIPTTVQRSTPDLTTPSNGSPQQFAELMGRINVLQGKIRRKQAESQQNLDQIRSAM